MRVKKIDILIPTYNRADNLKKNLDILFDTVIKNNLDGWINIIVSDNSSSDNTNEILNEYDNKYSFIYGFTPKNNIELEKKQYYVSNQQFENL